MYGPCTRKGGIMIKGFDLLMGVQICMIIFTFVLSIRYGWEKERTLSSYVVMPVLYSLWSGIVVQYFSRFFFLASLWFLLGIFVSVGIVVCMRRSILYRLCHRNKKLAYYPRAWFLLFHFLIATSVCCSIQGVAFLHPYVVDLWVSNEAVGLIAGLMNGLLWGMMGICYAFSPRHVYKKSSVLSDT